MITEIVSFDGTAFAPDYEVGFVPGSEPRLPPAEVRMLERVGAWPVIATLVRKPNRMAVIVRIVGSSRHALRSALFRWFDPEDESPKTLVGYNHDGVAMYVQAAVEELRVYGDQAHDTVFVATLVVDGDVRWRGTTPASDTWAITASGQTRVITNAGEDEAYPVLTIEPTAGKTGGFDYRHWVPVVWRSPNAGNNYPVMIDFDTATPIAATEMDAAGADLRLVVDGVVTPITFEAIDDPNTKIWFAANFARAPQLLLRTAFLAGDTVTSLDLDDEVEMALLPDAGTVLIGSEAFVYTGRSLIDRQLTGVTRAAKGTVAANHGVSDDVWWIQRDIYLLYGNASPPAPPVDNYPPVFDTAASDNETWVYDGEFGDQGGPWPGAWTNQHPIGLGLHSGCYTESEYEVTTPWEVLGLYRLWGSTFAQAWQLTHPCGIVNAAWSKGKIRASIVDSEGKSAQLRYWIRGAGSWTNQQYGTWLLSAYPLDLVNTWRNQADGHWAGVSPPNFGQANDADWSPAEALMLARYGSVTPGFEHYVEFGAVTVSLNADEIPLVTVGAQQGNYSLAATITNQATGEALMVSYTMDLNGELEINTDLRTVTDLADDSGQFQAVSFNTARRHWLRLLPGSNTLRWDDVGTNGVTVTVTWEERYY